MPFPAPVPPRARPCAAQAEAHRCGLGVPAAGRGAVPAAAPGGAPGAGDAPPSRAHGDTPPSSGHGMAALTGVGCAPSPVLDARRSQVHPPEALVHRSEEHTSELQSRENLVCRLLLEKKNDRTEERLTENTQTRVVH